MFPARRMLRVARLALVVVCMAAMLDRDCQRPSLGERANLRWLV